MVSFWGMQQVIGYLVRLKLYPQQRYVGSFKCKGKRQVCMNVRESNAFSNAIDKKEYTINHNFKCSDKCIIDLVTCYKCKMQYVGKTVDEFCLQQNKYKDNNKKYLRKEVCMQQHLFEGFLSEGRSDWVFFDDASIILLIKLILKILQEHYCRRKNFFHK